MKHPISRAPLPVLRDVGRTAMLSIRDEVRETHVTGGSPLLRLRQGVSERVDFGVVPVIADDFAGLEYVQVTG